MPGPVERHPRPRQRREAMSRLVRQHGRQSVEELARRFGVSLETVRRDLALLAERGEVLKLHGGAARPRLHQEASFVDRMGDNAEAKRAIAAKLAGIVAPGDTLFIDTGSTTLACADILAGCGGLTIITNSVAIARTLGARAPADTAIYLLGGAYSDGNEQTVGPLVIRQIMGFQADYAVLTVSAVDASVGAMDASIDEAQVARAMIDCSRQLVVLADSSKFGRTAGFPVARLAEIDTLVTEIRPEPRLAGALAAARVAVA